MIRELEEKDIAECVKLIRESFGTVAEEFGFTVQNAPGFTAFATTEEKMKERLLVERRPMYIYCEEDRIVGFYFLELQDENACELNNLCVSPAYRHRGIGEELLQHAFERVREYRGLYHVLGGVLSPINGVGVDALHLQELLKRLADDEVKEVIVATNPTVEGEATAMYIARLLQPLGVNVTRLAYGLPVGADLEYADEVTLNRAIEGRRELN